MYYLEKEVTIASSHHLRNYDGKCKNLHGHNWRIKVYCKGTTLNTLGILIDFSKIKKICNKLDHQDLNQVEPFNVINPTAENISKVLCEEIPFCYKVELWETESSKVTYVKD